MNGEPDPALVAAAAEELNAIAAGAVERERREAEEEGVALHEVPAFLGSFRHGCTAVRGRTQTIDLRESYTVSDNGILALIRKAGRCSRCGARAHSVVPRLVLASERAPTEGRVAR